MIKEKQSCFYAAVGRALTSARESRNITIAQLAQKSGEQIKTIQSIEKGKCCSLHHLAWMRKILGIDFDLVVTNMEGSYVEEKAEDTGIDSFI
jgi:transcriptional regulator with XRE-family HTH domain